MKGEFSLLTDRTGNIHSVEGEPEALRAMIANQSGDRSLFDLVPKDQHGFIGDVLRNVTRNTEGRISDISLITPAGKPMLFHLTVQPAGPGRWWFQFLPSDGKAGRQPVMIWVDFFDSVSYLIDSSPEKPIELMMLSFEALDDLDMIERIGKEGMDAVRTAIEETLSNHAVDGQIGRLDNTSYAVLYDAADDADDIVLDVGNATEKLGVGIDDLGARTQTMALNAGSADSEQVQAALAHVRRSFLSDDEDDFDDVPSSLDAAIGRIEVSKRKIVEALEAGDIVLRRYPVIALASGDAALHLMHGTLMIDGEPVQASRRLIMGDYPGLALQHDLAMTREAVLRIAAARDQDSPIDPIIIDINALSLAETEFETGVAKMIDVAGVAPQSIGFQVLSLDLAKQSLPSYRNLIRMLERGHPAWLTRFTSAVTDSTLNGAFVEVAVPYLQRLCDNAEGRDLVSQLLKIWRNAGVRLVATDVQSPAQARFIGELNIEYAIGPAVP